MEKPPVNRNTTAKRRQISPVASFSNDSACKKFNIRRGMGTRRATELVYRDAPTIDEQQWRYEQQKEHVGVEVDFQLRNQSCNGAECDLNQRGRDYEAARDAAGKHDDNQKRQG